MKKVHLLVNIVAAVLFAVMQAHAADTALRCSVNPERRILASGKPESAVIKVSLSGERLKASDRPAVNLALVIDRSGSMGGEKIVRAREAAIAAVERLDSRDIVSVIAFDDRIDTVVPAQSAAEKRAIVEEIDGIEARGSTAIFGGVSQAASEIRKNLRQKMVNRIVLLSDGMANVGPSTPEELGRLGAALVKESVSVSTIGVGLGFNEDLMTRLAGNSDGNSYFVENSDDLPRIFNAELGDVLSVAARKVKLTVRFMNGATPVELIGRDGRIVDGTVTIDFNQIYASQEKYVLIRTEFTPGKVDETRTFATATVSYEPPDSDRALAATATGTVGFSPNAALVKRSVDKDIMIDTIKNINATDAAKAIQLNDAGDYKQSQSIMSRNEDRAATAAAAYGIDELKKEATTQQAIGKSLGGKLEPRSRKSISLRNFSIQNQQKEE